MMQELTEKINFYPKKTKKWSLVYIFIQRKYINKLIFGHFPINKCNKEKKYFSSQNVKLIICLCVLIKCVFQS